MAYEDKNKEAPEFEEVVVFVNRCAKVVKGGRRFSFSAVMVVSEERLSEESSVFPGTGY